MSFGVSETCLDGRGKGEQPSQQETPWVLRKKKGREGLLPSPLSVFGLIISAFSSLSCFSFFKRPREVAEGGGSENLDLSSLSQSAKQDLQQDRKRGSFVVLFFSFVSLPLSSSQHPL